jgi:hypothetical protein
VSCTTPRAITSEETPQPTTKRSVALRFWTGACLTSCSPIHRDAVTVLGCIERMVCDLGHRYTEAEVTAALALDSVAINEAGRLNRTFASTWTNHARRSFAALLDGSRIGGK